MLFNVSSMPKVRLCKILSADKIQRNSTHLESFPKSYVDVDSFPRTTISEALQDTIWRMIRACLSEDGLGLAAPQIGVFKRIFVLRESAETFRVLIHPRYSVDASSRPEVQAEGCLSVPGKRIPVSRASIICAEWLDLDPTGKVWIRTEILEGLKARVFQHEFDHLSGVSILQKYEQQRKNKR